MAILKGNDIMIADSGGSAFIAAAKTHALDVKCDEIEVTDSDSSDYKDFIAGRKEWSVQVGHLIGTGTVKADAMRVGEIYEIYELDRRDDSLTLMGEVLCMGVSVKLNRGSLAQGAFTFRGKGELYPSTT